jgi:hypothetical protein
MTSDRLGGHMAHRDYSATPLSKKLGLKTGKRLIVSSAPYPPVRATIEDLLKEFPPVSHPRDADVQLFFTTSRSKLESYFPKLAGLLPSDGGLWIAWPKKVSKLNAELGNDLTFEIVQQIGLSAGLVDNKSCSIDDDWQALRFVIRRQDRPRASSRVRPEARERPVRGPA